MRHDVLSLEREGDHPEVFDNPSAFSAQPSLNSYAAHVPALIQHYFRWFGQWQMIHIRSNLYELGRGSFQMHHPRHRPASPKAAANFYIVYAGMVSIPYRSALEEAFEEVFELADWPTAPNYVDASDLFFIEHRMPTWQANAILESDCVWETMIILDSRNFVRMMLGIALAERMSNALFDEIIRNNAPQFLGPPYNPKNWPRHPYMLEGVRGIRRNAITRPEHVE